MHTLFSFVKISYNQKSRNLLRRVPFIKAALGVVALMTLGWSTQVIWRYATFSFFYVFPPSLTVFLKVWQATVFLKVGLWSFNTNVITWLTGMTYRNIKNELYKITWHKAIVSCILTNFVDCVFVKIVI